MSGGHFDYIQHRISDAADEINEIVRTNDSTEKNEWGDEIGCHYPEDIIEKFKEAVLTLHRGAVMLQRIDWLVCCDDGEDSFRKRWDKELKVLE